MSEAPLHLEGLLLLADPSLRDGIFDHSVVLLADHSAEDGAFGVILNHPTGHEVGDFLKEEEFAPLARIPVHLGGPVSREQLSFSAFWWNPKDGLHWQLRLPADQAMQRARQPGMVVRAFVGYSGWTSGQLENELRRKSWITAKPDAALFGREHDRKLWRELLRGLSPYHQVLAESPPNPELN